MNTVRRGNSTYKYEFFWRDKESEEILDSDNKPLPFPVHSDTNTWPSKDTFISTLKVAQTAFTARNKFTPLPPTQHKNCLLCHKKNVITGTFSVNGIRWPDGMLHYINKHNIKPSDEFIDYIYRFVNNLNEISSQAVTRVKGEHITKDNKKMLKLDRNQILIMDALMWHGGKKFYKDCKNNNIYRYSEHYGLLDFNNSGLDKIIIFANTNKVDPIDDDIYLPRHNVASLDYEYIFHTHTTTAGKPGGRVTCGILYEFPSVSDVFHFINHYNTGRTCGSLVITAEGLYIIRKFINDDKNIRIDEDELYEEMLATLWEAQRVAIEQYGTDFNTYKFYSVVAQNKTYIGMINKVLNKHELHIDYYPRMRDKKGKWFINTIYLSVFVVDGKRVDSNTSGTLSRKTQRGKRK